LVHECSTRTVEQLKGGEEFAEVLVVSQLELETTRTVAQLKGGEEFAEVLVISQLELETGDQHSAFALHSCLKGGEEFTEVLVVRQLELETGDQPRSCLLLPVPAPQQTRLRTLPRLPVL
jgi:hypothetical protein